VHQVPGVPVAFSAKIKSPVEFVSTAPNGAYVSPSSWYHELLGAPADYRSGKVTDNQANS